MYDSSMGYRQEYIKAALREGRDNWDFAQSILAIVIIVALAIVNLGIVIGVWKSAAWSDFVTTTGSFALFAVVVWLVIVNVPARMWANRPSAEAESSEGAGWLTKCQVLNDSIMFELHPLHKQKANRIFCVVEDPGGTCYTSKSNIASVVRDGDSFWHQFPHGFTEPIRMKSGIYRITWFDELSRLDRRVLAKTAYQIEWPQGTSS